MSTPEQWLHDGRHIRLHRHRIFIRDDAEREKPALLLIHGFPTASWDWSPLWPSLKQACRPIALDMLGFGFSDKPNPHAYSIAGQADLIEALLEHGGVQRCHLLAHDYGDTVAQELLARPHLRDRWTSACFLNGGLFPETHRARLVQRLLASPIGALVNRLNSRSAFDRSFSAVFGPDTQPSRELLDHCWALINHNNGRHVFHNLIGYMAERRTHRERWLRALSDAPCPLALINGGADPVSGAHMVERFRELLGKSHFIAELPRIGHYPQLEAPEQVFAAWNSFIGCLPR